ncbi:MAG: GNAT family N-acetyltransferase [Bacteroidales bacterium]|nr:GNAT family N-acetyltransferase [Bacteroidales bacterium]
MQEERIIMRALEPQDAEKVYEWENDYEQWTNGVNSRFFSLFAIKEYIANQQNEDIFACSQTRNIIELHTNTGKRMIGCVDLYDIDARHSKAGVGIYIDSKERGKHYATKSLELLEKYAANILCLHQLYAFVIEDNTASNSLFTSAGYSLNATLKNWVRVKDNFKNVNVYQKIL